MHSFYPIKKQDIFTIIVGAGNLENELKTLVNQLGINERIRFVGRRNDIPDFLAVSDAFVFPSLIEGLPLALVEATWKGLPCIVSNIESFVEIVEHRKTGLIINPNSIDQLTEAMTEIYQSPKLRQELSLNAKAKAEKTFNALWQNLHFKNYQNGQGPTGLPGQPG